MPVLSWETVKPTARTRATIGFTNIKAISALTIFRHHPAVRVATKPAAPVAGDTVTITMPAARISISTHNTAVINTPRTENRNINAPEPPWTLVMLASLLTLAAKAFLSPTDALITASVSWSATPNRAVTITKTMAVAN